MVNHEHCSYLSFYWDETYGIARFVNLGLDLRVQDTVEGEGKVLLDPNTLSPDGTVALSTRKFSEDAEFMAYGLSSSGSDWITIKVMRVKDRVVQPDTLSWVRYWNLLLLEYSTIFHFLTLQSTAQPKTQVQCLSRTLPRNYGTFVLSMRGRMQHE